MDKTYIWQKLDQFQRADMQREAERQRLIRNARRSKTENIVREESGEKQECPTKDAGDTNIDTNRKGLIAAHHLHWHSPLAKEQVSC
jgi:hypothetical protein